MARRHRLTQYENHIYDKLKKWAGDEVELTSLYRAS
jgi:hypothetical protein